MSESVQELLKLYENGIIDGEALNDALTPFNNAPQRLQPQEKIEKVGEKRRRKKKARKQRKATEKAAIAVKQKKCHE